VEKHEEEEVGKCLLFCVQCCVFSNVEVVVVVVMMVKMVVVVVIVGGGPLAAVIFGLCLSRVSSSEVTISWDCFGHKGNVTINKAEIIEVHVSPAVEYLRRPDLNLERNLVVDEVDENVRFQPVF